MHINAFLPLFPLAIVVFPGEEVRLHIFEPRYKQLIQDCADFGQTFGIPAVIDKQVRETGTLVRLREIVETHENGELDIIIEGLEIFRIVGPLQVAHPKLYSGAQVEHLKNNTIGNPKLTNEIVLAIRKLHATLKIDKKFPREDAQLRSYDVAHHAGLSLNDEYQLLCLLDECDRLEFLKNHLAKILPLASEIEALRERVKLNGYFRPT